MTRSLRERLVWAWRSLRGDEVGLLTMWSTAEAIHAAMEPAPRTERPGRDEVALAAIRYADADVLCHRYFDLEHAMDIADSREAACAAFTGLEALRGGRSRIDIAVAVNKAKAAYIAAKASAKKEESTS